MAQYFLISQPLSAGLSVTLDPSRSHYLCRVLRTRQGETFKCMDGKGGLWLSQLAEANPKHAVIEIQRQLHARPANTCETAIGLSLIKGAAMDRALQQSVELGANHIYLIAARRSNVVLQKDRLDNKIHHWQRIIEGACEQSGQLWTPTLHIPQPLSLVLSAYEGELVLLSPEGAAFPKHLKATNRLFLVGPEGGWETQEITDARANGAVEWSLGEQILRAETTPAVVLALAHQAAG